MLGTVPFVWCNCSSDYHCCFAEEQYLWRLFENLGVLLFWMETLQFVIPSKCKFQSSKSNNNEHLSSNNPHKRHKTLFMVTNKVFNTLSLDNPQEPDKASPVPLAKILNNSSSLFWTRSISNPTVLRVQVQKRKKKRVMKPYLKHVTAVRSPFTGK